MVAVDEGQVEGPALIQESRQSDLGFLGMELDQLRKPCFAQHLESAVGELRRLIRIDHDVSRIRITVRQQSFAYEQGGEAEPEPGLDGVLRVFADHPSPERLTLGGGHGNREQLVHRTVRFRDNRAVADEPFDHHANPALREVLIGVRVTTHAFVTEERSPPVAPGGGCSTSATTRDAMNRAVRTGVPPRVTSETSTMVRPVVTSTRRPARVATTSKTLTPLPISTVTSTLSPRIPSC